MTTTGLIQQLAEDQKALVNGALSGLGLSDLRSVSLTATPEVLLAPDTVEDAISRRVTTLLAGWLRRESWAGTVEEGDPGRDEAGVLLEGEWALTETESLSLFYDGRNWRLITLTEGASEGTGTPALREDVEMIGRDGRVLGYAVYWGAPDGDPSAIRRIASRLVGIRES